MKDIKTEIPHQKAIKNKKKYSFKILSI